ADIGRLDRLDGQGLRRVEEVDEGIGPGRDDADGLRGRSVFARPGRPVQLRVVEEALEKPAAVGSPVPREVTREAKGLLRAWRRPRAAGRGPAESRPHHRLQRIPTGTL